MQQITIKVDDNQLEFINTYQSHGFTDKNSLIRKALDNYQKEVEAAKLKKSADLYAEIYSGDSELKELTDSAIVNWPE